MNYYSCSFSYFVKDFFRNLILQIIQAAVFTVYMYICFL